MTNNVKCTMTNLTQHQIDHLDDYEYSLFLAYGDAYKPTPTVPARTGSNQLRKTKTPRFIDEAGGELLRIRKRLRCRFNKRGVALFNGAYRDHLRKTKKRASR